METKSLGFIGGGRITKVFLKALHNRKTDLSRVVVCDTNAEVLTKLKNEFPEIHITDSPKAGAKQDILFIALHPPMILETLDIIQDSVSKNKIVVSLAPKISLEKIVGKLGSKNVARMIPNATSYINEGYNPVCFYSEFSTTEKQAILEILSHFGNTFEVEENKLEAYAIISAMLPTYFWFQWKELQKIGVKMGLELTESKAAIQETLIAAIKLFYNSDLNQAEVMDLIPIKPIGEHEDMIKGYLSGKLISLFEKIKP